MHVAHELGSLDAALPIGLLVAAWWPHLAAGMLPVVSVAAALLCATALADLVTSATVPLDELPHLLDAVGSLLLWSVTASTRRSPAPQLRAPRRRAA
jgi:predicted anti-sigma-YlaC factor YlaD